MIRIEDIPDDTEFNRMFKKKFSEAITTGSNTFEFVIDENGKCSEISEHPEIKIEQSPYVRKITVR